MIEPQFNFIDLNLPKAIWDRIKDKPDDDTVIQNSDVKILIAIVCHLGKTNRDLCLKLDSLEQRIDELYERAKKVFEGLKCT